MAALGLAAVVAQAVGCTPAPPTLEVDGRYVHLTNTTRDPWTSIEIWVNDQYRVTQNQLGAGQRFTAPLDVFVAGFGQRFDPGRQPVRGVEATARTSSGGDVRLVWGAERRR
jgi:hypothetical protein